MNLATEPTCNLSIPTRDKVILGMTYRQRKAVIDAVDENARDSESPVALLGDGEGRIDLAPALIGVSTFTGRAVYDYEKLAQCYVESTAMTLEEANEYIDFSIGFHETNIGEEGLPFPDIIHTVETLL